MLLRRVALSHFGFCMLVLVSQASATSVLSDDEHAIVELVINEQFPHQHVLVQAETSPYPNLAEGTPRVWFREVREKLGPSLADAFDLANRKSRHIQWSEIHLPNVTVAKRDDIDRAAGGKLGPQFRSYSFQTHFHGPDFLVILSRVGFDPSGECAVAHMSWSNGALGGGSAGFYIAERIHDRWVLVGRIVTRVC